MSPISPYVTTTPFPGFPPQEIESFVRRNGLKPDSLKALRKVRHLRDQLLQHRLVETRGRQLVRLKQWEDDINALCSDSAAITVENAVDLALPPDNFIYKNDYVVGVAGKVTHGVAWGLAADSAV